MTNAKTFLGITFVSEALELADFRPTDLMAMAWEALNPDSDGVPTMKTVAEALKAKNFTMVEIDRNPKFAYTYCANLRYDMEKLTYLSRAAEQFIIAADVCGVTAEELMPMFLGIVKRKQEGRN